MPLDKVLSEYLNTLRENVRCRIVFLTVKRKFTSSTEKREKYTSEQGELVAKYKELISEAKNALRKENVSEGTRQKYRRERVRLCTQTERMQKMMDDLLTSHRRPTLHNANAKWPSLAQLSAATSPMRRASLDASMRNRIIASRRSHERRLSDSFDYGMPTSKWAVATESRLSISFTEPVIDVLPSVGIESKTSLDAGESCEKPPADSTPSLGDIVHEAGGSTPIDRHDEYMAKSVGVFDETITINNDELKNNHMARRKAAYTKRIGVVSHIPVDDVRRLVAEELYLNEFNHLNLRDADLEAVYICEEFLATGNVVSLF